MTTAAEPLAGAGDQPWFSYDTYGLNDRLGAQVNVGNGNLVVSGADLNLRLRERRPGEWIRSGREVWTGKPLQGVRPRPPGRNEPDKRCY